MICSNCGEEIRDGSKFCRHCGHPVNDNVESTDSQSEKESVKGIDFFKTLWTDAKTNKKPYIIIAIITGLLLVALVCLLFFRKTIFPQPETTENTEANNADIEADTIPVIDKEEEETLSPITDEMIEKANISEISGFSTVDFSSQNHMPNEKIKDVEWDETFFYSFEDTDTLSDDEDNYISKCVESEYCLIDPFDYSELLCEVYSDPNSSEIYKIVTIKQQKSGLLEVIDYYFFEEKPYFVFQRNETIYTPTYATLNKPGTRYYFNNDVLVRVRTVLEDSLKVSQTGLKLQGRSGYEEFDYFKAPNAVKKQYDAFEIEWLNRSYNILNSIRSADSIGVVCGTVKDSSGNNISRCKIAVQNTDTEEIVYTGDILSDGSFSFFVYLDNATYRICFMGGDDYQPLYINNVRFSTACVRYSYNDIVMYPQNGSECQLNLTVFDGNQYTSSESTNAGMIANIKIREGMNAKTGPCVYNGTTDENGYVKIDLPQGNYTIEAIHDAYVTSFINVNLSEQSNTQCIYMVKNPTDNQVAVLLTWDTDNDIDLTVFTPYQGIYGDMDHIGGYALNDEHGNSIISDNSKGCELAYIDVNKQGRYKIYVCDYEHVASRDYYTDSLANCNARIYIYYPDGRIETIILSARATGVVWEVAEVSNSSVSIQNRVYSTMDGKGWWLVNKSIVVDQQNTEFTEGMQIYGRLEKRSHHADEMLGGSDYDYYVLCFDYPVSFVLEDDEGKKTTKNLNEIAIVLPEGLSLNPGQYISGYIQLAAFTVRGEPVLGLEDVDYLQLSSTMNTGKVPSIYRDIIASWLSKGRIGYTLAYIGNNSTPELVICDPDDDSHPSGSNVYTYDNGAVELIGKFGTWGEGAFTYFPYQNLIIDEETSTGCHSDRFYRVNGHSINLREYEVSIDDNSDTLLCICNYNMDGTNFVYPSPHTSNHISYEEYKNGMSEEYSDVDINTAVYVGSSVCKIANSINDIEFE